MSPTSVSNRPLQTVSPQKSYEDFESIFHTHKIRHIRIQWADFCNQVRARSVPMSYFRRLLQSERPRVRPAKVALVQEEEPPQGATGLALAEHYFGPLLSPVVATPARWTAYNEHRRAANAEHGNVFDHRKRRTSDAVAEIEDDLGLDRGTLQKCVSILGRDVLWDDDDPRDADVTVRTYSPAAPKYVEVHVKYHCRRRMYEIEWYYSIGYKIFNRVSGSSTAYRDPCTNGPPSMWHSRGGWQSICWGHYDDDRNYRRQWRRIEVAGMELHEGVLDIHEALFGPIETPPTDHFEEILEYRRKLVTTVRSLLAVLGIQYKVACTDEENDRRPEDFMLEGLGDMWVARGIRAACGFQLSGDAEAARRGKKERIEQAEGEDNSDCEGEFFDEG